MVPQGFVCESKTRRSPSQIMFFKMRLFDPQQPRLGSTAASCFYVLCSIYSKLRCIPSATNSRLLLLFFTSLHSLDRLLRLLLYRRLLLPHGVIPALELQQLRVRAPLYNLSCVQHQDLVRRRDGGEAMPGDNALAFLKRMTLELIRRRD